MVRDKMPLNQCADDSELRQSRPVIRGRRTVHLRSSCVLEAPLAIRIGFAASRAGSSGPASWAARPDPILTARNPAIPMFECRNGAILETAIAQMIWHWHHYLIKASHQ